MVPESVAALPIFAELLADDIAAEAPPAAVTRSDLEIVIGGDVVIRAGAGVDERQLTGAIPCGTGCSIVKFGHGGTTKVFVATRPVDFRNYAKQIIRLSSWQLILCCQHHHAEITPHIFSCFEHRLASQAACADGASGYGRGSDSNELQLRWHRRSGEVRYSH